MKQFVNIPFEVFSIALKRFIALVILPYSSKMNNPERRARLFLKYGNGFSSERFKFCYDTSSTLESLSSRKKCFTKSIEMI